MSTRQTVWVHVTALACLFLCNCGGSNSTDQRHDAGDTAALPSADAAVDVSKPDLQQDTVQPTVDTADSGSAEGGDAASVLPDVSPADVSGDVALVDSQPSPDGPTESRERPDSVDQGPLDQGLPIDSSLDSKLPDGIDILVDTGSFIKYDASADTSARLEVGQWDANGQCNGLVNQGPLHDVIIVAGPTPSATGGTIEDGLYYETAVEIFGSGQTAGPTGEQRRMTMVISGQTFQGAFWSSTDGDGTQSVQLTPGPGAGQIDLTTLCPAGSGTGSVSFGYAFSGTGPGATLQLIYPGSPTSVLTLTQQ